MYCVVLAYTQMDTQHKSVLTMGRRHLLLHSFNGLFSTTTWVTWYRKGKTSLDLNEARDGGVWGCSGISWTICKQSAPRSRQITTPTPRHPAGRMGRRIKRYPNPSPHSPYPIQLVEFHFLVTVTFIVYKIRLVSEFTAKNGYYKYSNE